MRRNDFKFLSTYVNIILSPVHLYSFTEKLPKQHNKQITKQHNQEQGKRTKTRNKNINNSVDMNSNTNSNSNGNANSNKSSTAPVESHTCAHKAQMAEH